MTDLSNFGTLQIWGFINVLMVLFLSWYAASLSARMKGKSFWGTLQIVSVAVLVFAVSQVALALAPLIEGPWDMLHTACDTLFVMLLIVALLKLDTSLHAYQYIIRKKH